MFIFENSWFTFLKSFQNGSEFSISYYFLGPKFPIAAPTRTSHIRSDGRGQEGGWQRSLEALAKSRPEEVRYRGTSLIRNTHPSRITMGLQAWGCCRVLRGGVLMSEAPLYPLKNARIPMLDVGFENLDVSKGALTSCLR